jgi:hypothetical protein
MTAVSKAMSLQDAFNDLADMSRPLLHLARSSRLQREAAAAADAMLERIHTARLAAILSEDEVVAGRMLAFSCLARALASELRVYLLLKSDEPEQAWNMLITAQENVDGAMRADPRLRSFVEKGEQLRRLEEGLFPPQTFTSMGMLARRQRCSICRQDYDDCDHVAGRAYLGRFCSMIPEDVSTDHVAIVENPADRRCRLTSQGVSGVGMRNLMTWEIVPDDDGNETPDNLLQAILAVANDEE